MKITSVKLTKKILECLSANDRTLLLLLGNVSNEINVLQKLIMMVRKGNPRSRIVDIVEAGQALIFMRMLVGKLHEARVLVDKRVNGDERFEGSFAALSEDEPWDFYLSDIVANSFYYASEMVVTRSMIGLTAAGKAASTNKEAEAAGLAEVFDAALDAASLLSSLFQILMVEIIDKSIDEQLDTEDVDIGRSARMSEFHLPYFFDEEDLLRLRSIERAN